MTWRPAFALLVIATSCGPGVDEPDAGSHQIGESCSFDRQCGPGLRCESGTCVSRGDYIWQWGSEVLDYASCVGTTADGVWVGGGSFGDVGSASHFGSEDIFVTFTANDGEQPWTTQWGTASFEAAYALVTAADGSAFVAGYSRADLGVGTYAGGTDIWVSHVSPEGVVLETWQWGTGGNEWALNLALTGDALYVVGRTDDALGGELPMGQTDAFLVRLSLDGVVEWTRLIGTSQNDVALAAAAGPNGGVFVGGDVGDALPGQAHAGDQDLFLARFESDGSLAWIHQWGTSAPDKAYGATSDAGHVYLTGQTDGELHDNQSQGASDIFLVKVAHDGTRLWTRQWGSSAGDVAAGVALARDGDLLVTAAVGDGVDGIAPHGKYDILLSKVTPEGERLWSRMWGGPEDESPAGLAVSESHVYVSGATTSQLSGSAGGVDAFLLRTSE